MKTRLLSFAVVLALLAGHAFAQTPATSAAHTKARHLLELTGAAKLGLQMMEGMLANFKGMAPDVPDEFWKDFRARVKPDDLVDMLAPIYEKHLTEEDLDALIKFYESPVGRRFIEKQPLILADSMKVGEQWGERLANDALAEMAKKGYGPKEPKEKE